jgi:hypothetical protein
MTVGEAIAPNAPVVLPSVRNPEAPDKPTNVASHVQFARGDLKAGSKAADFVVERELNTTMVHQGYSEPHNAIGTYYSDGKATIELRLRGADDRRALELADRDFRHAIRLVRKMAAKSPELGATTSLARLLVKQDRRDEARAMLAEIYNWFTEGFDTLPLKEAKALLDDLNTPPIASRRRRRA